MDGMHLWMVLDGVLESPLDLHRIEGLTLGLKLASYSAKITYHFP